MNLPSEKVYFAGLTSIWPEITRIPNIPHLARHEGVTSGESEETTVTLDSRPPQEIGSSAVGGAVGVALRADRCPCGVRAV